MEGPAGNDFDHTLANLQSLLYLRRRGARGWMYGDDFLWTVLEQETMEIRRTVEWGLLSVFCLGDRRKAFTKRACSIL